MMKIAINVLEVFLVTAQVVFINAKIALIFAIVVTIARGRDASASKE